MAEKVKDRMLARVEVSFSRARVVLIGAAGVVLYEDNHGTNALPENLISSGYSKHVDVR